jgi:hypothetical protein
MGNSVCGEFGEISPTVLGTAQFCGVYVGGGGVVIHGFFLWA